MSNSKSNWEKVSAFCSNTVIVKVIKNIYKSNKHHGSKRGNFIVSLSSSSKDDPRNEYAFL